MRQIAASTPPPSCDKVRGRRVRDPARLPSRHRTDGRNPSWPCSNSSSAPPRAASRGLPRHAAAPGVNRRPGPPATPSEAPLHQPPPPLPRDRYYNHSRFQVQKGVAPPRLCRATTPRRALQTHSRPSRYLGARGPQGVATRRPRCSSSTPTALRSPTNRWLTSRRWCSPPPCRTSPCSGMVAWTVLLMTRRVRISPRLEPMSPAVATFFLRRGRREHNAAEEIHCRHVQTEVQPAVSGTGEPHHGLIPAVNPVVPCDSVAPSHRDAPP